MESLRYHHVDLLRACLRCAGAARRASGRRARSRRLPVKAELRGVDSHGLVRLPVYAQRIQSRVVNARPKVRVVSTTGAAALVDGDNGLGPVVGAHAMDVALDLARQHGTGFVGVRRSNHFGPAAYYVEKAIAAQCIGVAISNAPPNMAPFGGRTRFLGTNPLAIGIPAGRESPLIFDASTSVVARGKIIVAAQTGKAIPEGWALDPEGHPTTDARLALAGAVLPFGGPKGSALSFIIDIACGVMTGAAFASHLNTLEDLSAVQNVGHVLAAVRTDLFMSDDDFRNAHGRDPRDAQSRAPGAWCRPGPGAWRNRAGERGARRERGHRAGAGRSRASLPDSARRSACRFRPPLAVLRHRSIMNIDAGQTFNFLPIPTDVHFGFGNSPALPHHVPSLGGSKVFVVTDPGVRRSGIVDGSDGRPRRRGR